MKILKAANTSPPLPSFYDGIVNQFKFFIMKILLKSGLALFFATNLFIGCKRQQTPVTPVSTEVNPYEKNTLSQCFSCSDESPFSTLNNVPGKVIRVFHDPIEGFDFSWAITISKESATLQGYVLEKDSILAPCPIMDQRLLKINQKVLVSGTITNCKQLFGCPECRFRFGRKLIVTSIKAN